jgi:hypothetical protein
LGITKNKGKQPWWVFHLLLGCIYLLKGKKAAKQKKPRIAAWLTI